jgi:hypothetical protein
LVSAGIPPGGRDETGQDADTDDEEGGPVLLERDHIFFGGPLINKLAKVERHPIILGFPAEGEAVRGR